ncbi:type IV pilus assembly protein PilM [Candidatus Daviesbacteria bacterium]|nr:type IV pilus assembly protein PilM [Candidatus Daviesbacteria bacterium]
MSKSSVGLDIGFSSIKAVALSISDNPPKLLSLGMIGSPQPGLSSDGDLDLEAVAVAIKKLFQAARIEYKEVVAALPESKVFTRVIDDLPYLSDSELSPAIRYASEEFIPLPVSEVNLNWQVLSRAKGERGPGINKSGRTVVFVVASPKNIINKYLKVLEMAGVKVRALETEIIASTRALVGNNPFSPTTLIVQMGTTTTDFAVVSKGLILLTRSISTGGLALTRAIAGHFNFEMMQAEEYKKVYGILPDQLEGQVYQALKPVTDVMVEEARRVTQAFQTKNPQNQIKRVVLSGGGAKLPGLVQYLASNLGLEVQEADPWYFLAKESNVKVKLAKDASLYSVAVGLALRED